MKHILKWDFERDFAVSNQTPGQETKTDMGKIIAKYCPRCFVGNFFSTNPTAMEDGIAGCQFACSQLVCRFPKSGGSATSATTAEISV